MIDKYAHTTQDEFDFLENIGTYRENGVPETKKNLLKGYLVGASKRVNWGEIDKDVVINFAKEKLDAAITNNL